ncbi:polysaccharide pyruvyl transferase family protein [Pseudorhodoferax sp. LjRoot39]|uniref:polysaccharide pyruvyl transferase family protein n=1 Tax=Pseudorhodoferax sp. LjRoot39 TaxID=3342328 RepID=UPI003ECC6AD0
MSHPSHQKYIAEMQDRIHAVLAPLVGDQPLAVIDFPDIRNVGDSAIWVGEIAYLKNKHHTEPRYASTVWDFSEEELERAVPQGPIFIHGGGNFGDIWLSHQEFRERILQRFKHRRVIQFPQSIHYNDPARVELTARTIAAHKNFVLLVRDQESLEFAQKRFDCEVHLCPDMAFSIGAIQAGQPDLPVLAMLREDKEKVGGRDLSVLGDCPVEDWITEPRLPVKMAKVLGRLSQLSTLDRSMMRFGKLNAAANQRLGRGTRQLSRARAIVTDRLHVHIISTLMGLPHAVLDNSYGKITRFMEAFPGAESVTYRASSLADGFEWARAQAQQQESKASKQGVAS